MEKPWAFIRVLNMNPNALELIGPGFLIRFLHSSGQESRERAGRGKKNLNYVQRRPMCVGCIAAEETAQLQITLKHTDTHAARHGASDRSAQHSRQST